MGWSVGAVRRPNSAPLPLGVSSWCGHRAIGWAPVWPALRSGPGASEQSHGDVTVGGGEAARATVGLRGRRGAGGCRLTVDESRRA